MRETTLTPKVLTRTDCRRIRRRFEAEGYSQREAAGALGISLNTYKALIVREELPEERVSFLHLWIAPIANSLLNGSAKPVVGG